MVFEPDKKGFSEALAKNYLWYLEEVIALLEEYGLQTYIPHVTSHGMSRWYPEEVLGLMHLVDESTSAAYPTANASIKHIPDFLLK